MKNHNFFHYFSFTLAETYGEEQESIHQTAILWKNNVSAFIGPQETCEHEARLAASVNLPMISHFCTDTSTSNKVFLYIFDQLTILLAKKSEKSVIWGKSHRLP